MSRSPYPRSDRDLLGRIQRSAGEKAGYKQLVRELGLGGGRERRLLLEQLTRMVARGELALLEDHLWAIPKRPEAGTGVSNSDESTLDRATARRGDAQATFFREARERLLSGRLELHRDGFGFVRVQPGAGEASSRTGDVFIPPNALHGAMHGDLVLVDEDPPNRDGRRSGRIARVLTRRNPSVVGVFHYGADAGGRRKRRRFEEASPALLASNYVQPWDERLQGPILIPPGAEAIAPAQDAQHRTLGEEAMRASRARPLGSPDEIEETPDPRWPLEGLAVEAEITQYPQAGRPAVGRLIEVLGPPDAFGVDVEIIIRKHGIPHTFPPHVLAEAEEQSQRTVASLSAEEAHLREDFRGLPIVTIDGESARDFDDAVLVRSLEDGLTELQVHIADVSHYVLPGSPLDTEARVRGTSVYFPDRAVPMLPHALSSGMCSLRPEEDRLVLSCVMVIDARGEIVRYRVAEGIIRSVRRMTYTSVQQCLNASPDAAGWNTAGKDVTPQATEEDSAERLRVESAVPGLPAAFDGMLQLALRLNAKRVRRGSIDFDLPEPVVEFDPDGNMKAIVRSERGWAHRLIEEFMLSANECVATWLTAQGIPSIYRIHELPDPKRILDFEETAAAFGQTLGVGALPVKRLSMKADRREAQRRSSRGREGRLAAAHELPDRIPVTPQMYQRLVRRIAGQPEERILSYLMLRSLKQARYSEKNEGHFALASPCYTHFTSPIRRYPDLIVHRLLRAMLRRKADPQGAAILSTDPQPWKTGDARRTDKAHATHAQTEQIGLRNEARRRAASASHTDHVVEERPKRRGARAGRIGWSEESVVEERTAPVIMPAHGEAEPLPAQELADIALESSQAERRAADAERELIEWKKMKFMADKIGDDFKGLILSVTKFGFFVELDDLFVEGLVPLSSLVGDFYSFRDGDRSICGARSGHCFRVGDAVEVILDRIDRQQQRLQFALLPGTEPRAEGGSGRRSASPERETFPSQKKRKGKVGTERKGKRRKR